MVNYCVTKDMPLKPKNWNELEILRDWYKHGKNLLIRDLAKKYTNCKIVYKLWSIESF